MLQAAAWRRQVDQSQPVQRQQRVVRAFARRETAAGTRDFAQRAAVDAAAEQVSRCVHVIEVRANAGAVSSAPCQRFEGFCSSPAFSAILLRRAL